MYSPANQRDPLLGRVIGRYRLSERIGSGGMGAVYRAEHLEIPTLLSAVKLLAPNCLDNDILRRRFRDEAAICARLGEQSPYIVQIRDYGVLEDRDQPYYMMEFLRGTSLEVRLREGAMPLAAAIALARQLCDGLALAHQQQVIHRDLKPANIFLLPDAQTGERVKILDFGIAKLLYDASTASQTSLTQGYMGTPRYSSPEQLQGRRVEASSDIYSLGLILYEMLCGDFPFVVEENSYAAWYQAHNMDPPRTMAMIPPAIEAVVQQCLAKDPRARPANAVVLYQQLELAWQQSQGRAATEVVPPTVMAAVEPPPVRPPATPARRGFSPLIAAGLGGAAVLIAVVLWPKAPAPAPVEPKLPQQPKVTSAPKKTAAAPKPAPAIKTAEKPPASPSPPPKVAQPVAAARSKPAPTAPKAPPRQTPSIAARPKPQPAPVEEPEAPPPTVAARLPTQIIYAGTAFNATVGQKAVTAVALKIDGDQITAQLKVAPPLVGSGILTGTRQGNICELSGVLDQGFTMRVTARCTRERFVGSYAIDPYQDYPAQQGTVQLGRYTGNQ